VELGKPTEEPFSLHLLSLAYRMHPVGSLISGDDQKEGLDLLSRPSFILKEKKAY
jgi:hypothetical protein